MKKLFCVLLVWMVLCSCAGPAATEGPGSAASQEAGGAAEPETIRVAYMLTANPAEERDTVQSAINETLLAKGINVQIELICVDYASWTTQMNLMLTDGSVDLFNAMMLPSVSVLASNDSIAPMDELLDTYGQGIREALGDYLRFTTVNDRVYATPNMGAFSAALMFAMNKEVADDVGIDPEAITDKESLTEALLRVQQAYPDMTMISTGVNGRYLDLMNIDFLGTSQPVGCIEMKENSDDLTVSNYFESGLFQELLDWGKRWSELGFFMNDPLNAQDGSMSYVANGQAFGGFCSYASESIAVSAQEKTIGRPIYVCQLEDKAWSTTSRVTGQMWCISSLSERKEAAMQFLNALYSDPDIANLACNGIEGEHYVMTENGNITFADGLDTLSTGWPANMGTFWPNITITHPWEPDAADFYQELIASNSTCLTSPAAGFTFDADPVSDEVTACTAVVEQYLNALLLDIGDTDTLYEEFLASLESAGIQEVIGEKQSQLDAWALSQS